MTVFHATVCAPSLENCTPHPPPTMRERIAQREYRPWLRSEAKQRKETKPALKPAGERGWQRPDSETVKLHANNLSPPTCNCAVAQTSVNTGETKESTKEGGGGVRLPSAKQQESRWCTLVRDETCGRQRWRKGAAQQVKRGAGSTSHRGACAEKRGGTSQGGVKEHGGGAEGR